MANRTRVRTPGIKFNTGNNREQGSKDLVTLMKLQESNGLHYRAAVNYGHDLMHTSDKYHPGSMDAQASDLGIEVARDYQAEEALKESFEKLNLQIIDHFLDRNYILHPDSRFVLKQRVMTYDKETEGFILHIPSTLKYCIIGREDPMLGNYEAMLEAEKELGDNPGTIRDLIRYIRGGNHIWHIKGTKLKL